MQVIICLLSCCFSCVFCFCSLFFLFCLCSFLFFFVVSGFVTVSFHCLLLHFNHLLGALCLRSASRSGGKFEVTPRELLLDWGTGAWGLACPGLADLFVQRVSFRFIFIGGGAAATGSLGQNNSLKRAIETSEIMPTNVGYLHSYVGYAPLERGGHLDNATYTLAVLVAQLDGQHARNTYTYVYTYICISYIEIDKYS